MIIWRTLEKFGLQSRKQRFSKICLTYMQTRRFCSDDDFKPKSKIKLTDANTQNLIKDWIQKNDIVLFMKGTPSSPLCGYSNFVVQLLKFYGINNFFSVNILNDPILRQQVKIYSKWPTYPQLYLKGELIGGCDIIRQMHDDGQLVEIFKKKQIEVAPIKKN